VENEEGPEVISAKKAIRERCAEMVASTGAKDE